MYISIVIKIYIVNVKYCDNSVKIEKSTLCVYNSHNFIDIKSIIKNNPILLNDDTLPTIDKNIKCINSECKKSPSIKYIKYDFENIGNLCISAIIVENHGQIIYKYKFDINIY